MSVIVQRLVRQIEQRGLKVVPGAEPGQLLLSGPAAAKTPEVIEAVKAFKPQLLELYGVKAAPDFGPDDGAAPDSILVPVVEPFPPGEPLPPSDDCPVLSAGEASPKAVCSLLGSTRPGSAYRHQTFKPQQLYPWEERRDGPKGVVYYRVYTRAAVCCLRPPKFGETFRVGE